jgi:RNA polymerase sigma-70 factor (ECF subfamily)
MTQITEQFRRAWESANKPSLPEFVQQYAPMDSQTLGDLVLIDLEHRLGRGEIVEVEDYFDQYPQLAEPDIAVDLIAADYEIRSSQESSTPTPIPPWDASRYMPPNEEGSTSTRLLRQDSSNSEEAWRQLVTLYGPVVRFWIRGAGLGGSDLADVFQEVFVAVIRNIGSFERQTGKAKFRAWLKVVVLSKANDHFRRQGKQPVAYGGSTAARRLGELAANAEESEIEDASLAHSEYSFLAQRTLQIVRKEFRDNTWAAFYRTAIDGATSQEVAAELGISAVAVRKAKSRVMQRLREAMESDAGSC